MYPLQTIFDLVMCTFLGEDVLMKEENKKLWNPIVKNGVKALYKEGKDAGIERYSCRKELLLEYMATDN